MRESGSSQSPNGDNTITISGTGEEIDAIRSMLTGAKWLRFTDGKLTEKPMVSIYFNAQKVHQNVRINQVWGGANSGIDGGNDGGKGITDTPQGLKLQAEGHDVRYRNTWIKELDLKAADTDF